MQKARLTSKTQQDFIWPRVIPILERPALPPLKTGIRQFCPKPQADHCKQDVYQEYDTQLDSCKPAKLDENYDDNDALMSRKKFQLLNESFDCKPVTTDKTKLMSTYQVNYVHNELTYEKIKDQLLVPIDEANLKKCRLKKQFYDPFPFKKINDKEPLLG